MDTDTDTEIDPDAVSGLDLLDLLTETQTIIMSFDVLVSAMREGKATEEAVTALSDLCADQMTKIDEALASIMGVTPEYLDCLR